MHEFRVHEIVSPALADNPWYPTLIQAVMAGFHDKAPSESLIAHQLTIEASQRSKARGVWETQSRQHALAPDVPVATFLEWAGVRNIGGAQLDVHQISDVTVRASHRRQGLLRRLMTDSLNDAHRAGLAVAALTASDASIYGRFGFGTAVFEEDVTLESGKQFALTAPTSGSVEYLQLETLAAATHPVMERFQEIQPGSLRRTAPSHEAYTGQLDESREPNKKIRAAGHWDEDGVLDGYITWESQERYGEVKIVDFITTTETARLALWAFIAQLDLIHKVHFRRARIGEPLPWLLEDSRRYKINSRSDLLWLRILDPVTALSARDYEHDGEITFRVRDEMGFADGVFRLEVSDGRGVVHEAREAELEIDVAALGALLLGGASSEPLMLAGQIAGDAEPIERLARLLHRRRAPYCMTPF